MSLPEFLLTCVLAAVEGGHEIPGCEKRPLVDEIATAISQASKEHKVSASVIAAVAYHESKLNPKAIGPDGLDIGIMQVRRGGAIPSKYSKWSNRQLQNIRLNVNIGASYLAKMSQKCSKFPLSRYNGRPCRDSSYSRSVLGISQKTRTRLLFLSEIYSYQRRHSNGLLCSIEKPSPYVAVLAFDS
jgi:hypothetical protein